MGTTLVPLGLEILEGKDDVKLHYNVVFETVQGGKSFLATAASATVNLPPELSQMAQNLIGAVVKSVSQSAGLVPADAPGAVEADLDATPLEDEDL